MKAFEQIKKRLGYYLTIQKYKKYKPEQVSFTGFFQDAFNFLLILPDDDAEFRSSLEIVYTIAEMKKNVKLFMRDFRVSLVKKKENISFLDYGIKDITKLYLPTKEIISNISENKFDVIIDFNMVEDSYAAVIVASINAKYKVGFKKGKTDNLYNLLIINNENNPAFSYRNLLNSLKMFK